MADFDGSLSQIAAFSSDSIPVMTHCWLGIVGTALLTGAVLPPPVVTQTDRRQYARIAVLRPHDGKTVDFEAGYSRHLAWHQQAGDKWIWYGWNVWAGERQRWFIYASFGHSAASLDSPVLPAEDERDNILTLWYRMVAGGAAPRYVRLRPRASLSVLLDDTSDQALPETVRSAIAKAIVEILNLRPTMSYGLSPARQ